MALQCPRALIPATGPGCRKKPCLPRWNAGPRLRMIAGAGEENMPVAARPITRGRHFSALAPIRVDPPPSAGASSQPSQNLSRSQSREQTIPEAPLRPPGISQSKLPCRQEPSRPPDLMIGLRLRGPVALRGSHVFHIIRDRSRRTP
jgi:hypothetical protein